MKEHEVIILEKMKHYAVNAVVFMGSHSTIEEFSADYKTIAACTQYLSQVGECVSRLDDEFIRAFPQIPWRKLKNLRNQIVHDYDGIQVQIVWDILTKQIQELINNIDNLLQAN